jgi:hypothetical protein
MNHFPEYGNPHVAFFATDLFLNKALAYPRKQAGDVALAAVEQTHEEPVGAVGIRPSLPSVQTHQC